MLVYEREKWNKVLAKRLVSHSLADFIVCTTRARRKKLVLTLVCSRQFVCFADVYSWFSELKCAIISEILEVFWHDPRPSFPPVPCRRALFGILLLHIVH